MIEQDDRRQVGREEGAQRVLQQTFGSDKDAADLLKIGERTFADLQREPWFPVPIVLGPRLRRWDLVELLDAVRTRAPRGW